MVAWRGNLTDHVSEVGSALGGLDSSKMPVSSGSVAMAKSAWTWTWTCLLVGGSVLLGGAELPDETHGLASKTAGETSAGAGVEESAEVVGSELEEVVKFDSAVRELWRGSRQRQSSQSPVKVTSHGMCSCPGRERRVAGGSSRIELGRLDDGGMIGKRVTTYCGRLCASSARRRRQHPVDSNRNVSGHETSNGNRQRFNRVMRNSNLRIRQPSCRR